MDKVRFGYFPDFSDPTLLFFGSEKALNGMKSILVSLSDGQRIKLEEDIRFCPLKNTRITISLVETMQEAGITFLAAENPCFEWLLSKEDISDMLKKLEAIIRSNTPCHHYFDSPSMNDKVTIEISKDEYPENFGSK